MTHIISQVYHISQVSFEFIAMANQRCSVTTENIHSAVSDKDSTKMPLEMNWNWIWIELTEKFISDPGGFQENVWQTTFKYASTLPTEFCPTWGTVGEESQTPGWTSDARFPAVVFAPTHEGQ